LKKEPDKKIEIVAIFHGKLKFLSSFLGVRDCVKKGELEKVFEFLKENYPKLLEEKDLYLALYGQQFLEFIRLGEIGQGIELAQKVFPNNEEEILDFIDYNGKLVQLKLEVKEI